MPVGYPCSLIATVCVCMWVCVCLCVYVCVGVFVCVSVCVCGSVGAWVCVYVCICVCMCVSLCQDTWCSIPQKSALYLCFHFPVHVTSLFFLNWPIFSKFHVSLTWIPYSVFVFYQANVLIAVSSEYLEYSKSTCPPGITVPLMAECIV